MAQARGGSATVAQRIAEAEDLLCTGLSPGQTERQLAKDYGVSTRQARKYIARVYEHWREQSAADAPHRREKIIRMVERFYVKALVAKQWAAASHALTLLGRMSGGFVQHDPVRQQKLDEIGPPPTDPTGALLYAQRVMSLELAMVASNQALDPERRLRWIAELCGKIGMTHAKALIEERLEELERRLGLRRDEKADGPDEAATTSGSAPLRAGRGGDRSLPGPVPPVQTPPHAGDPS